MVLSYFIESTKVSERFHKVNISTNPDNYNLIIRSFSVSYEAMVLQTKLSESFHRVKDNPLLNCCSPNQRKAQLSCERTSTR